MFALVNLLRCYSLNKRVIKARNDGGTSEESRATVARSFKYSGDDGLFTVSRSGFARRI